MKDKKYNEDYYLEDENILKSFQFDTFIRKEKKEIEEKEYRNIIKKYNLLINRLAKFIKNVGYNDSIECSLILSYMIHGGFVSYNGKYLAKEITADKEITSRLGTTIVRGMGVCRNFASMHKDVFDELKLFDKQLYCYQGFGSGKDKSANHVINLINYNNDYYGIDIYNGNRLYRFINELCMREIGLYSTNSLRYKSYYELLEGDSNIEDIKRNLRDYKKYSLKEYIDPITYANIKFNINQKIIGIKDDIKEFYYDNESLMKRINNSLL